MKFFFHLLFILSLIGTSFADQRLFSSCQQELKQYCSSIQKDTERISCLLTLKDKLTNDCQQELQRINEVLKGAGARGGGGLASFGGVMGRFGLLPPTKTVISINGVIAPEGKPTVIEQGRLNVSSPIWSREGKAFALSAGAGSVVLNEKLLFDNGEETPRELHRLELGGQYSRTAADGRFYGARLSVGSASDRPFYSKDEISYNLNGFYTADTKTNNLWIWTVFLSNNNPVANFIPIPGFIYLYKKDGFTGMFGLPFLSMQWTPKNPWVLSLSAFFTNVNAELTYGFRNQLQYSAGFSVSQQSFLRQERDDLNHRLFFNEKKVYTGVKTPLNSSLSLDGQLGLSFDRSLKEGERFNDTELEADLGKSWFVSLGMNLMI